MTESLDIHSEGRSGFIDVHRRRSVVEFLSWSPGGRRVSAGATRRARCFRAMDVSISEPVGAGQLAGAAAVHYRPVKLEPSTNQPQPGFPASA